MRRVKETKDNLYIHTYNTYIVIHIHGCVKVAKVSQAGGPHQLLPAGKKYMSSVLGYWGTNKYRHLFCQDKPVNKYARTWKRQQCVWPFLCVKALHKNIRHAKVHCPPPNQPGTPISSQKMELGWLRKQAFTVDGMTRNADGVYLSCTYGIIITKHDDNELKGEKQSEGKWT